MTTTALGSTPFTGRRRELGEVRRALTTARCVTLIGFGGAGKTRLARHLLDQVAAEPGRPLGDTWWVGLGDLRDPATVQMTVAEAVGLHPQPGHRQVGQLAERVGDRPALLVLDNCEHLIDACTELAVELLAACPGLRVLSTSRQPLGLAGELVYRVPPLSLPGAERDPASLLESEAVALFTARAAEALPGFEVTDANADAVAGLCTALEGVPLALELAAARVRTLSPQAMLDRLQDRYRLLSRGFAGTPDRQRSMEASVTWSYDLCSKQEKLLWERLSVFVGGVDLDAAEDACSDELVPREQVLDLLSSLVDKSVLFRDPDEEATHYRMLDTIRELGVTRLAQHGDPCVWEERQTRVGVDRIEGFARRWMGPEQAAMVRLVRRNHANLRAILQRTCTTPEGAETGLQLVVWLEHYWVMTGRLTEGVHWLSAGLRHGTGDPVVRASAHAVASYLSALQLDLDAATRHLEEGQALAAGTGTRDLGLDGHLAFAAAGFHLFRNEAAQAEVVSGKWLQEAGTGEHLKVAAMHLLVRGLALSDLGRVDEAVEVKQELERITGAVGERYLHSMALWSLSLDLRERGELDRAVEHASRALGLKRDIGDEVGVALCLESLAAIASVQRDPARSATLQGAAERLWRRIGVGALSAPYLVAQRELGERLARGLLRDQVFETAYRRGQAMTVDEAVGWALATDRAIADDPFDGTGLTRREREIALLIGEGLTNQQIADRLVISVRTAQGHVENILRKLDMASRTQVATWVVARTQ